MANSNRPASYQILCQEERVKYSTLTTEHNELLQKIHGATGERHAPASRPLSVGNQMQVLHKESETQLNAYIVGLHEAQAFHLAQLERIVQQSFETHFDATIRAHARAIGHLKEMITLTKDLCDHLGTAVASTRVALTSATEELRRMHAESTERNCAMTVLAARGSRSFLENGKGLHTLWEKLGRQAWRRYMTGTGLCHILAGSTITKMAVFSRNGQVDDVDSVKTYALDAASFLADFASHLPHLTVLSIEVDDIAFCFVECVKGAQKPLFPALKSLILCGRDQWTDEQLQELFASLGRENVTVRFDGRPW